MTNAELAKKLDSLSKMSPPAAAALAAIGVVEKTFKAKLKKANKRIKLLREQVADLKEILEQKDDCIEEQRADLRDLERDLSEVNDEIYELKHPED